MGRTDFGVAVGAVGPDLGDLGAKIVVCGTLSQGGSEVGALCCKKAGVEFAVGG